MSFLDSIATTTVTPVDTYDEGPARIYWHNGTRQSRTGGKFYTKTDQYVDPPVMPWTESNQFEGELGYETGNLMIAVIAMRQQAFFKREGNYEWLPKWQEGAQLYTELLVLAEGIEDPVIWVSKGLTGRAAVGKGGILSAYRAGLLRDAEKLAGKKLPSWTFWLPIATKLDAQGRIAYVPTGFSNNTITPPALHLPHNDMAANIEALFVGNDLLEFGRDIRQEFDTGLKTKRGVDGQSNIDQNATPSALSKDADALNWDEKEIAEDDDLGDF